MSGKSPELGVDAVSREHTEQATVGCKGHWMRLLGKGGWRWAAEIHGCPLFVGESEGKAKTGNWLLVLRSSRLGLRYQNIYLKVSRRNWSRYGPREPLYLLSGL